MLWFLSCAAHSLQHLTRSCRCIIFTNHSYVLQSAITLVKMIWRQFFLRVYISNCSSDMRIHLWARSKIIALPHIFSDWVLIFSHFFKHLQTWASDSFLLLISLLDAEASKEFSHQAFPSHGEWSLSFRFPACLADLFLCSFLCSLQ